MPLPSNVETYESAAGIQIALPLSEFLRHKALPGSGVDEADFLTGLATLVNDFSQRNRELLRTRDEMQAAIDAFHLESRNEPLDRAVYREHLERIGYLVPTGAPFLIETSRIDREVASLAGPQLVVPLNNARYAINAANARWGSLYDALYGTDALGTPAATGPYDDGQGRRVIAWVRKFLDEVVGLKAGTFRDIRSLLVRDRQLSFVLADGTSTTLRTGSSLVGYRGEPSAPSAVLIEHNGLGIEIVVDRSHPVGADDPAGVADVILEGAISAVMDCEDSVAAVDAADKVVGYRNWLGLMKGDLAQTVRKDGLTFRRTLAPDRPFTAPDGSPISVRARALLFIRNVGHLMTTPAVLDGQGKEAYEGLVDAAVTVLCALHDIRGARRNSPEGSIYVVKPKMHGPEEVQFAADVMSHVEEVLGLEPGTVKLGLMDEERRTSVNLLECVRPARDRIAFINTGFLDRTGDEVHTSNAAGPMVRKADMRAQPWMEAYEEQNVRIGLACGFAGRAQIGKGMWAAPDRMADMLAEKVRQLESGASCAWVPSPTAATLHATHYHRVDVAAVQREIAREPVASRLDELLTIPLALGEAWSDVEIQREIDNNAQGILGYVVRWIDLGVGCSKVPDIDGVPLMEDRATCRISSQLLANWLRHDIVSPEQVRATLRRMAEVVDTQNRDVVGYEAMGPDFEGAAFRAASDLVFLGAAQPSGYTEPILHSWRAARKRTSGPEI